MLIIVIASAAWVYVDAKAIGVRKGLIDGMFNIGAGAWCAATLLLWIVVFPAYLIKRGALKTAVAAQAGAGATQVATLAAQGAMFCTKCGANIISDAKFCTGCGTGASPALRA
jgi:hypothetical protein